ncbi:MAG: hypothetical protein AABZ06_09405 [Bdellovibrionota bacterium]
MRNRLNLPSAVLIFAVIAGLWCQWSYAANCDDCREYFLQEKKHIVSDLMHKDLLARNKAYLEKIYLKDSSKAIKAKSNILVITIRIETNKNNLESLRNQIESKGCGKCER